MQTNSLDAGQTGTIVILNCKIPNSFVGQVRAKLDFWVFQDTVTSISWAIHQYENNVLDTVLGGGSSSVAGLIQANLTTIPFQIGSNTSIRVIVAFGTPTNGGCTSGLLTISPEYMRQDNI